MKKKAKVVINDLDEEAGKAKEDEINDKDKGLFVKLDVTNEEGWQKAVKEVVDHFGRLDYLVNSAGISVSKNIKDSTVDDFNKSVPNQRHWFILRYERIYEIYQREQRGGSIVNIGSIIRRSWT